MFNFDKLDRHSGLVKRMADTIGTDLGDAMISGKLTGNEFRNAVYRCTGCTSPDDCEHWLADHSETGASETPDYCRNADLLAKLKD